MPTFLTPNRHGYSVRFSPFNPDRLVVATSQYFGLAGGGTLFHLDLSPDGSITQLATTQWSDGLFDVSWSETEPHVVVTASGDGGLQLWNLLDTATDAAPISMFREHQKEVYSVDWTRTRREQLMLSASWDRTVKLWDPNRKTSLGTYTGHSQLVYSAMWSPHVPNLFASVSGDGNLNLWNSLSGNVSASFKAHDAEVLSCDWCMHDQNIIATGGSDGLIRGWDIRNCGRPIFQLKGCEYAVRRVRFSPHKMSVLAAVSYDFTTRLWDFGRSCDAMETLKHHSEFVYGLDWNLHREGQLADCGWDSLVQIFEPVCLKGVCT